MDRDLLGILVMLNNYLHDLAVGVLFSSIFLAWLLWRRLGGASPEGRTLEHRSISHETVARGLVPRTDPAPAAHKGPPYGPLRHHLTGIPVAELVDGMATLTKASLIWIVLGGVVRALAYRDYEWQSAAGNGQVLALVVKHIVLVSTVIAGLALQYDLRRRLRQDGYHRGERRDRRVFTCLEPLRPLRALRWIRGPSAHPEVGESKAAPRAAVEVRSMEER